MTPEQSNTPELDPQTLLIDFATNLESVVGTDLAAYALLKLTELIQTKPGIIRQLLDPGFLHEIAQFESDPNDANEVVLLLQPDKVRGIRLLIEKYKGKTPGVLEIPAIMGELISLFR